VNDDSKGNKKTLPAGVILFLIGLGMFIAPQQINPKPQLPELYLWWASIPLSLGVALLFFSISSKLTNIIGAIAFIAFS
jgi:hypothetical protein